MFLLHSFLVIFTKIQATVLKYTLNLIIMSLASCRYNTTEGVAQVFANLEAKYKNMGGDEFFKNDTSHTDDNVTLSLPDQCGDDFKKEEKGKYIIDGRTFAWSAYMFVMRIELDMAEPSIFTQIVAIEPGEKPITLIM